MAGKLVLRREYLETLRDVWKQWDGSGATSGSPFMDLDMIPELDEDAGYNHTLGWVRGVAEAKGWSTDRPRSRRVPA